ncbi:probable 39S ribosomal protein L24, mitochondrial [Leptopilina boulardi]|uniref:probable 39S ribosomal protein L24, mitochondrial n=1 Tax=Leptopilina boulardi TaxID=63433 RepID=UPI0021F59D77|nr:probable 39S ribosomal protein L24, mitochondrial [Leptopilina boulardi]
MPRGFNFLDLVGKESIKYANLPERYVKRTGEQIAWKTPRGLPNYLPRTVQRKKFNFSIHRPWTSEFSFDNSRNKSYQKVPIEPIKKWSFFRGDKVEVLTGRDKGKQGVVSLIFQERNWVNVQGLNTKMIKIMKNKEFPGVNILRELPLLVNEEVSLIDPSDMKPTEIEWRFTEEGEEVRVSKRTGRVIPIPNSDKETIDYKLPSLYKPGDKDTKKEEVEKITFKPELKTFEMDIMDKMGIKEDRIPQKTYWY